MMSVPRQAIPALIISGVGMLPVLFLGGIAPFLDEEMGMNGRSIGGLATSFYLAAGLFSFPLGALLRRLSLALPMLFAVSGTGTLLIVIAMFGERPIHWLWWMICSGVLCAVGHPLANELIRQFVPSGSVGVAAGMKQATVPTGALLGGAAALLGASVVPWRTSTTVVGVSVALLGMYCARVVSVADSTPKTPAVPVAFTGNDPEVEPRRSSRPAVGSRPRVAWIVLVCLGSWLGSLVPTGLAAIIVYYGVSIGVPANIAGATLGAASLAGIATRLGFGWVSDRVTDGGRDLGLAAALLGAGVVGLMLLSASSSVTFYVVGTILAMTGSWGWSGLVHGAVVRQSAHSAARTTGLLMTGVFLSSAIGPSLLAWLLAWNATVSWWIFATVCFIATILLGAAQYLMTGYERMRSNPTETERSDSVQRSCDTK